MFSRMARDDDASSDARGHVQIRASGFLFPRSFQFMKWKKESQQKYIRADKETNYGLKSNESWLICKKCNPEHLKIDLTILRFYDFGIETF